MSKETVASYIDLLEKSFILICLRGFSRNLRKEITKTDKFYFSDLGIRNALINNFNSFKLRNDHGQLWENFLVTERIKYQSYAGLFSNNFFWRTYTGAEIDWIEERQGNLYAYDFKYGNKPIKMPCSWKENYPDSEYETINLENYHDLIG
jgi:predicted AAA+ superfamily ATPase